jgi:allophanate hydrolase subunit 1
MSNTTTIDRHTTETFLNSIRDITPAMRSSLIKFANLPSDTRELHAYYNSLKVLEMGEFMKQLHMETWTPSEQLKVCINLQDLA